MKTLMSKMQKKLAGQRFDMLPVDWVVEPDLEVFRPYSTAIHDFRKLCIALRT